VFSPLCLICPQLVTWQVQERIAFILLQLQRDMHSVLNRLTTLETITMTKQQVNITVADFHAALERPDYTLFLDVYQWQSSVFRSNFLSTISYSVRLRRSLVHQLAVVFCQ